MGLTLLAKPSPRIVIVTVRNLYPQLVKALVECGCLHPSGEGSEELRTAARRLRGEIELLTSRIREVMNRIGVVEPREVRIRLGEEVDKSITSIVEEISDTAEKVEALVARIAELETPGSELARTLQLLETYSFLDVDLSRLSSGRFVRAKVYIVDAKTASMVEEHLGRIKGLILYSEPGVEKNTVLYVVVYPPELEETVVGAARKLKMRELGVPEGLPSNIALALKRLREELEKLPREASKHADKLSRAVKTLEAASEILRVIESTRLYNWLAVVEGNISPSQIPVLKRVLDSALGGAYTVFAERHIVFGEEVEREPTEYSYPSLLRPFAELIEMYGHPKPYEIVPLVLTAITLPIIFGLMFPDLGHGIVLALVALYFLKRGGEGGRWLGLLVLYMAVAAMVTGFLAGEFFGVHPLIAGWLNSIWHGHPPYASPVHPIAELLLGEGVEEAGREASILVLKSAYIALGLGALLLAIAAWSGFAKAAIRRDREEIVAALGRSLTFTGVLVVFAGSFYIAGWEGYSEIAPIVASMGVPLGVKPTPLENLFGKIALTMVGIGLLIILVAPILFGHEEGIGMRMISGLMEVFDTLLLAIGNTVSFIRIMGLMLAHSSLVFGFLLIGLISGPAWPIVYAFGNLLVIALEALIATTHTLRLHFYEMYSKFYEGGGVAYKPARLPQGVVLEIEAR